MADYVPLLVRAVSTLDTADARRELYQRVRDLLVTQLSAVTPALKISEITRERLQLEEAIRKVEREALSSRPVAANRTSATDGTDEFTRKPERDHEDSASARPTNGAAELAGPTNRTVDPHATIHHPTLAALARLTERVQKEHIADFVLRDGVLRLVTVVSNADRIVAVEPLTQELQLELRRRARELETRTLHIDAQAGWTGLKQAAGMLTEIIHRPATEIADEIGTIWRLSVALGGFAEQCAEARDKPGRVVESLQPDAQRSLRDLAMITSPWIRRFPTARALEDEARKHASQTDIGVAKAFFHRIEQAGLLHDYDAKIIRIAININDHKSKYAQRALGWSTLAVRNAGIAMIEVLGAVAAEAGKGPRTDILDKIGKFILEGESELRELISPRPRILSIVVQQPSD